MTSLHLSTARKPIVNLADKYCLRVGIAACSDPTVLCDELMDADNFFVGLGIEPLLFLGSGALDTKFLDEGGRLISLVVGDQPARPKVINDAFFPENSVHVLGAHTYD